jgi:signal transduction histidine kinase
VHKLLERQVRRYLGAGAPIAGPLADLLAAVDGAYIAADADRALVERSLELASRELLARNEELRRQLAELRAAEAAQRESVAMLTSFFDGSPFPIAVVDFVGGEVRFVALNEAGRRLPLVETGPVAALLRERALGASVDGPVSFQAVVELAGQPRDILVTQAPVAGIPHRSCVVVQDVTEVRHMEARLRVADRMASMGTVAAGVAHEINNPLAFVVGNLEFIANSLRELPAEATAEIRESLEDARHGTERVRRIVRDLKVFSRPDDEGLGPVDVRRLLDSSISFAANEIRHRARLVREYAEVPEVHGNSGRLGQVFVNLLVNAAQAIPEGAADLHRIRVVIRPDGARRVAVEVHDTGGGIPEAIRDRIFEPFFTTRPVGMGTGLGLAICHGIITEMGGQISVDSAVGQGTVVRVSLPTSAARSVPAAAVGSRGGGRVA